MLTRHWSTDKLSRLGAESSCVGCRAMETVAPAAANIRAGSYGSGIPAQTGWPRSRCSFCLTGAGRNSYRVRSAGGAIGPSGAHAPVSQQAHVPGGRLSGAALGNPPRRIRFHAGFRFSNLPETCQQSNPCVDARLKWSFLLHVSAPPLPALAPLPRLRLHHNRSPLKTELLSKPVHQIPLQRKMQFLLLVREDDEHRRPDARLRHVFYLCAWKPPDTRSTPFRRGSSRLRRSSPK